MDTVNTTYLNGTRFLLALWVAIGHYYSYIGGTELFEVPLISKLVLNADPAVDGFMVITGFLMMYHYIIRLENESHNKVSTFVKFWLRRLFRLFPLYATAIIIAFILYKFNFVLIHENYQFFTGKEASFNTTYSPNERPKMFDLLAHLAFVHGFFKDVNTSILGPAWSLSLEMQFYILFPFMFLILNWNKKLSNIGFLLLTIISIISSIVTPKLLGTWAEPGIYADLEAPAILPYNLHLFVLGMIIAAIVLKKLHLLHLIFWLIISTPFQDMLTVAIITVIVSLMFSPKYDKYLPTAIKDIINFIKKLLSNKLSQFGADISYSLYLIHMIILPYAVNYAIVFSGGNKLVAALVGIIVFLILNLLISYILFRVLEMPVNSFGKKLLSKIFINKNTNILNKGA